GRLGVAYGTDCSRDGLRKLAESAVALAKGAAKDEFNELPRGRSLGRGPEGWYDPAIEDIDPAWKLRAAQAAEKAASGVDRRVTRFDSTGAGDFLAHAAVASSRGAAGESRASYAFVYSSPVAAADGQLQTGSCSDTRRRLADLQAPEEIGRLARPPAARLLGARPARARPETRRAAGRRSRTSAPATSCSSAGRGRSTRSCAAPSAASWSRPCWGAAPTSSPASTRAARTASGSKTARSRTRCRK